MNDLVLNLETNMKDIPTKSLEMLYGVISNVKYKENVREELKQRDDLTMYKKHFVESHDEIITVPDAEKCLYYCLKNEIDIKELLDINKIREKEGFIRNATELGRIEKKEIKRTMSFRLKSYTRLPWELK